MTPSDDQPLQFDTAIPHESLVNTVTSVTTVTCASCQNAVTEEYFDVNGQSVCKACRDQLAEYAETPRGFAVLGRGALFGAAAAIAGAILYYAVVAITNFEIGLVAIAIGYMVGYSVRRGARGKGGRRFQVLALVLTYWSVGLAYVPFAMQGARQANEQAVKPGDAAAAPQATDTATPQRGLAISLFLVAAFVSVVSLILPAIAVVSSLPSGLISAAIIAFGMHQAWRLTAVPVIDITGPYKIASAAPPSA